VSTCTERVSVSSGLLADAHLGGQTSGNSKNWSAKAPKSPRAGVGAAGAEAEAVVTVATPVATVSSLPSRYLVFRS
jgi:hypothetical protein